MSLRDCGIVISKSWKAQMEEIQIVLSDYVHRSGGAEHPLSVGVQHHSKSSQSTCSPPGTRYMMISLYICCVSNEDKVKIKRYTIDRDRYRWIQIPFCTGIEFCQAWKWMMLSSRASLCQSPSVVPNSLNRSSTQVETDAMPQPYRTTCLHTVEHLEQLSKYKRRCRRCSKRSSDLDHVHVDWVS